MSPKSHVGAPNPRGAFLLVCSWFFASLGPGCPSSGFWDPAWLERGSGLISVELQRDRSRSHRRRTGRSPAGSQLQGSNCTRPGRGGGAGRRAGDRSRRPCRDPAGVPEQALDGLNDRGEPPHAGSTESRLRAGR